MGVHGRSWVFMGVSMVEADGSGIGPRKEVEKLGVEVKVDLPGVGQHLVPSLSLIHDLLLHGFSSHGSPMRGHPSHLPTPPIIHL
jgi:hypothetical protein